MHFYTGSLLLQFIHVMNGAIYVSKKKLDVNDNTFSFHHNFMIITCPLDAEQNSFHQHELHRYNVMAHCRDENVFNHDPV